MNKELVKKFYSVSREKLSATIYNGKGYAYATNAHQILRWQESGEKYEPFNCDAIFSDIEKNNSFILSSKDYHLKRKKLPLVPDWQECGTCEGEGDVEWEYLHYAKTDECPNCLGEGEIKNSNNMVFDTNAEMEYEGMKILVSTLDMVMLCFKERGIEKVEVSYNKGTVHLYADFGEYDMIFMASSVG